MPLKFERNTQGSDYVVADIHGCYDKLFNALTSVNFDFTTDRAFCVGDMVDRGPDSLKVLQLLDTEWFFSVLGNHELMAVQQLERPAYTQQHIDNGGQWFVDLPQSVQWQIAEDYINKLPYAIQVETADGLVGIIHADCPNDWKSVRTIGTRRIQLLEWLWGRDRFKNNDNTVIANIHTVYHGHTVVPYNVVKGNRVYIDTGAVFNNDINIIKLG